MPKLPVLTSEGLIKLLLENGFELDLKQAATEFITIPPQKKRVVVPYQKKDLPKGTFLSILKQAGLRDG